MLTSIYFISQRNTYMSRTVNNKTFWTCFESNDSLHWHFFVIRCIRSSFIYFSFDLVRHILWVILMLRFVQTELLNWLQICIYTSSNSYYIYSCIFIYIRKTNYKEGKLKRDKNSRDLIQSTSAVTDELLGCGQMLNESQVTK